MESSTGMSTFCTELEWKPKHWAAIFLFNRRKTCNVLAVLLVLFPLLMQSSAFHQTNVFQRKYMKEKGRTTCDYFHLSSELVLVLSWLGAFETEFSILRHCSIWAPHSLFSAHHCSAVNNFLIALLQRSNYGSRVFLNLHLKEFLCVFQWFHWALKFWQYELCSLPSLELHPLCLMWTWHMVMMGTRPLRSVSLDHRGNVFGKASYKSSLRLGSLCWSLGDGDIISSSSRWLTVTWNCSNQLILRDSIITNLLYKM